MEIRPDRIFLAWKKFCTRSHYQAKHLGASEVFVFSARWRSKAALPTLVRYVVSTFRTVGLLASIRPSVVLALNQPPPLLLTIYLYSKLTGAGYVLDSHSAPFNDAKWAWFRPIYKIVTRSALVNINTNRHHQKLVEQWGGRSVIMSDIPIEHERTYPIRSYSGPAIAVVASFMFDEPIAEILKAAEFTPEVTYFVTGDSAILGDKVASSAPENVNFTGFLSREDYFSLLTSAQAVMVLTTRDHTMQMGAYEALSLEQPIVTSDWAILRESFGESAVYVDNTAESIAEGVREIVRNQEQFKSAAKVQKALRKRVYFDARDEVAGIIEAADDHGPPAN